MLQDELYVALTLRAFQELALTVKNDQKEASQENSSDFLLALVRVIGKLSPSSMNATQYPCRVSFRTERSKSEYRAASLPLKVLREDVFIIGK